MRFRRLIILMMLVGWVLLSPVAIALGGCAGMWAPCDGPCVLTSCALPTPTHPVAPQVVTYLPLEPSTYLPQPVLKLFKPPPESIFSLFPAIA